MHFNVGLFLLVLVVHLACLYMLLKFSHTCMNQKTLLINISVYHVLFASLQMFKLVVNINSFELSASVWCAIWIIQGSIGFVFILTMHCITIDRFLEVFLHLKYSLYVTNERIRNFIIVSWVVSILMGTALSVLFMVSDESLAQRVTDYTFPTVDLTFLLNATYVYSYLYWKSRQCTRKISQIHSSKYRAPRFLLPGLIVLTYVVFNATGGVIQITGQELLRKCLVTARTWRLLINIVRMLYGLGGLSDATVYILMQRSCRRILNQHVKSLKKMSTATRIVSQRETSIETKTDDITDG